MSETKFTDDDKHRGQNPFTDSDLKRLKENRDDPQVLRILTASYKLDALLARLEAAEALIADYPQYEPEFEAKRQAWRTAKGETQ